MFKNIFLGVLGLLVLVPSVVLAHQPVIVSDASVHVADPEISKAYYGKLSGDLHMYRIDAAEQFNLYVNVLVPDIKEQKKNIFAVIIKDGKELSVLDGTNFGWTRFFEPFGSDTYWKGPEYSARAEAGKYEIRVGSSANDSKYVLAIGETEAFGAEEIKNAFSLILRLKHDFFNESPASFIFSPFGAGFVAIIYIISFIVGFVSRAIFAWAVKAKGVARQAHKNIGSFDRVLRAAIGIGFLLWAITTTWNPILILFSGFALFEAIFSWCVFYAALGKNTCSA